MDTYAAYYTLDGNPNDTSDNALNGTLTGKEPPRYEPGCFGKQSCRFTGNQKIDIPKDAIPDGESLTVSALLRLNSRAELRYVYGRNFSFSLGFNAIGNPIAYVGTQNRQYLCQGRSVIPFGKWCHIGAVLDAQNKTLSVYLNGQRDHIRDYVDDNSDILPWTEAPSYTIGSWRGGGFPRVNLQNLAVNQGVKDDAWFASEYAKLQADQGDAKEVTAQSLPEQFDPELADFFLRELVAKHPTDSGVAKVARAFGLPLAKVQALKSPKTKPKAKD